MNTKITPEMVTKAAVALYLETGKDHSAAEIAVRLACPPAAVHRVMREAHGCVAGLQASEERRPSHSKNYRAMETGSHKVWVYGPSRETLRRMISFASARQLSES